MDEMDDLEQLRAEARSGFWGGRKLTFVEQCGAFAALYDGVSNRVVAKAFGLAPQTVSKLSGCLANDPDPYRLQRPNVDGGQPVRVMMDHNRSRKETRIRHYGEVAAEFEALGRDEFFQRYYTDAVVKRILLAKVELRREGKKA